MARFQESQKRVGAQLDTSGADVARSLAQSLNNFSDFAGGERREIVEKESLAAGLLAGSEGQLPRKNEFSVASKAFNRGLRASYLAEVQTDIRSNMGRIAQENALNPKGFENAALAWEAKTLEGIEDAQLQVSIKNDIRNRSSSLYQNIADAKFKAEREEAIFITNNEIFSLDQEIQGFASEGDEVGVADNILRAWSLIDEQVESGFKDLETGQTEKIELQKNAHKELALSKLYSDFESMDSFDKAVQVLEDGPNIKNMTNEEMRSFKQTAELELKRRIDRENLDEANNDKLSDDEQKANYNAAQFSLLMGELGPNDLKELGKSGAINGDQALDLANKMGSHGRGIDSPVIENQVTSLILKGDYQTALSVVNQNIGSNLSDATARGYMEKLQQYTEEGSILTDPKVNRFRQHLKTSIGYKDSMSGFFDPAMQQRWGAALLKFDDAVEAGENPRAAFFRITNDFTTPEQRFEAMRNPYGSDNKDDLNTSLENLLRAKDEGLINEDRYNKELKYLMQELMPAQKAAGAWVSIVNNEPKLEKAETE